jgi:hypothetical protein
MLFTRDQRQSRFWTLAIVLQNHQYFVCANVFLLLSYDRGTVQFT